MRVGDDGLHLLQGVLAGLRIVAFGEHAAGGADLDQVRAVFDVLAHHVLHRGDAVGHAVTGDVEGLRQQVVVHVAAGDAERRTADLHVRSFDEPFVDGVAQIDIGKAIGSHIAHGGDPRFERDLRIACADQRALGNRGGELVVGVEVRVVGEMGVDIDNAGEQRGVAEVDGLIAGLRLYLRT